MPSHREIEMIRVASLAVACAETSCNPDQYSPIVSPLDGHCGAMATMIRGIFGGDIIKGKVKKTVHYWNRLPCGTEFDLTSCQFGGDGYTPLAKGTVVKEPKLSPNLVAPQFLLFAMRVKEELGK